MKNKINIIVNKKRIYIITILMILIMGMLNTVQAVTCAKCGGSNVTVLNKTSTTHTLHCNTYCAYTWTVSHAPYYFSSISDSYHNKICLVCSTVIEKNLAHTFEYAPVDKTYCKGVCSANSCEHEVTKTHSYGSDNVCDYCGYDKSGQGDTSKTDNQYYAVKNPSTSSVLNVYITMIGYCDTATRTNRRIYFMDQVPANTTRIYIRSIDNTTSGGKQVLQLFYKDVGSSTASGCIASIAGAFAATTTWPFKTKSDYSFLVPTSTASSTSWKALSGTSTTIERKIKESSNWSFLTYAANDAHADFFYRGYRGDKGTNTNESQVVTSKSSVTAIKHVYPDTVSGTTYLAGSVQISYNCPHTLTTTYDKTAEKHTKKTTCSICGYSETSDAVNHVWNTSHKCTVCSYQGTHSYGNYTVTTAATCTSEGAQMRTCACGAAETATVAINSSAHNYTGTCGTCGTANVICSYNSSHVKSHTCDTTPPTATGISLSATYTNTGKIRATATGVSDDISGVNAVQWYLIRGTTWSDRVWADQASTGNWYKDIDVSTLDEGQYSVGIVIKDNAGNSNDTTSGGKIGWVSFYYDKTAPTMNSLTASSTTYTGSDITLTGKATDSLSGIVAYAFAKESVTPSFTAITATTSEITQSYTIKDIGTYYFYVKDQAGNINSTSVTITTGNLELITEWTIPPNADDDGSGTTIKFPVILSTSDICVIDWGDGTSSICNGANGAYDTSSEFPTHEYLNTSEKVYTISLSGTVKEFGYSNASTPSLTNSYSDWYIFTQYITGLKQWGEIGASKYGFAHCKKLTGNIPTPTEKSFLNATSLYALFMSCSGLTGGIPEGLFNSAKNVENYYSVFNGCTGLTGSIPSELFANSPKASTFTCTFMNCTGLSGNVPQDLFEGTDAVRMINTFYGCTGLTGKITNEFFESIPNATSLSGTFRGCTGLTALTVNTGTIGANMFYGCNGITDITIGDGVTSIDSSAFYATTPYSSTNLLLTFLNSNNTIATSYDWASNNRIIDNEAPTVTASNITYPANASISVQDTLSGITHWGVTTGTTAPSSTASSNATTGSTLNTWYPITKTTSATSVKFTGLNAGTYYAWGKDAAGNTKYTQFKVNKATITAPSSPSAKTYNGSSQNSGITAPANTSIVTASSTTSATNAGTYNVVLQLSDTTNYTWSDGTTESKTITWTINKATPTISASPASVTITEKNSTTSTVTYNGDGALSVSSSDTGVATATISNKVVTIKAVAKGSATITVSAAAGTNYAATSKTVLVTVQAANYSVGTTYYPTLATAYAAITGTSGTIKVEQDNTDSKYVEIAADKTITLDMNGKTITRVNANDNEMGFYNHGTFIVDGGGTITTLDAKDNSILRLIQNTGTLTLKDVEIVNKGIPTTNEHYWEGVLTEGENSKVTIDGATIRTPSRGMLDDYSTYKYGARTLQINSGTLEILSGNIINESDSKGYALENDYMEKTTIRISGGTLTSNYRGISVGNSRGNDLDVLISGGTVTATEEAIVVNSGYAGTKAFEITGGKLVSTNNFAINNPTTSSIVIGDASKALSTEVPEIVGNEYAIRVTNGFNFNSGVLKGISAKPYIGTPALREGNYYVKTTGPIDGVYSAFLETDEAGPEINVSGAEYPNIVNMTMVDTGSGLSYWGITNTQNAPTITTDENTTASRELDKWFLLTTSNNVREIKATNLNAGTYYAWAKDALGNITSAKFEVTQATPYLNPSKTSTSLYIGTNETISYSYNGDASALITASSSDDTKATVEIDTTNKTVTINAIAEGNAVITLSAPAEGNFKAQTATINVAIGSGNYRVNGKYYDTLGNAYNAITEDEGTIEVIGTNIYDYSWFEVAATKKVTIEMNGNTIIKARSSSVAMGIYNKGSLTIKGGGTITTMACANNKVSRIIQNEGTLVLEDVELINKGYNTDGADYWQVLLTEGANASVTIDGATLKTVARGIAADSTTTNDGARVIAVKQGKLEILSGNFIEESDTVGYVLEHTYSGATEIRISGGTFTSDDAGFKLGAGNGKDLDLVISGGTIESNDVAIAINSTYVGTKGVEITGGTVISHNTHAIYNGTTASIIIGSEIAELSTEQPAIIGKGYGVHSANGFNFNNGVIKGENARPYYGTPDIRDGSYFIKTTGPVDSVYSSFLVLDEEAPEITVTDVEYPSSVNIIMQDTGSGLTHWAVTTTTSEPTTTADAANTTGSVVNQWYPVANTTASTTLTFTGLKVGTYYAYGKDAVGNVSYKEFKVTADPILMAESYEDVKTNNYILGNAEIANGALAITRDKVKTITIIDTSKESIPANAVTTWDVSKNNNGSVIAGLVQDTNEPTKYNLYIGGNGKTIATSGYSLFAYYTSCTSITGLDNLDTSKAKSFASMFMDSSALTTIDVTSLNSDLVEDMSNMFRGCTAVTEIKLAGLNTSKVTNFNSMFQDCGDLQTADVSGFVTTSAKTMTNMFYGCDTIETLEVSNFRTPNVTDMTYMFGRCSAVKELKVSNFDTTNVTSFKGMFQDCGAVTTLDVDEFKTGKVANFSCMFQNCTGLTSLDVSNFDTSAAKEMVFMFENCSALTSLDLSSFDTTGLDGSNSGYSFTVNGEKVLAVNIDSLITGCSKLETILLGSKFDRIDGRYMFKGVSNLKAIISIATTPMQILNDNGKLADNRLETITAVIYVPTEEVEALYEADSNYASKLNFTANTDSARVEPILSLVGEEEITITPGDTYEEAAKVAGYTSVTGTDITPAKVKEYGFALTRESDVNLSTPGKYEVTYTLTLDGEEVDTVTRNVIVADWSNAIITEWTIPANADSDGTGTTIKLPIPSNMVNNYAVDWGDGVIEQYDSNAHFPTHEYTNTAEEVYTIKVAGTVYEFGNVAGTEPTIDNEYSNYYPFAQYLTKLVQWGELEASRIGFSGCRNLAGAIPLPTENSFVNVENASCMFKYCSGITSVPEGLFANASNITLFTSTFQECSNLTSIPKNIFANNKEVTHFNYVLRGTGLTSIPSGLFASNTKAETFEYAFADCTALTTIGTGLFDNNNEVTDFGSTFENCTSLTSIPAGLFAGQSKAENFRAVFYNCQNIASSIPADLFDGCSAATSFEIAFKDSNKISGTIPAALFEDSVNATNFSGIFENCAGLEGNIPAGLFKNNTKVENVRASFMNCTGLTGGEVLLDTTNVTNADLLFWNCSNMTTLILGENFKKLDAQGEFGANGKLNAIIMLNDADATSKVATLEALDTINLPTQTIIYVSNETVEAVYEEAWDGIIDATRVEPLLALEGSEIVEISVGQTYTEDGYKVAGYNLTNKAEYEKYGYEVTYEDSEATDTLGSFVRTYTLTRKVNEVEEVIDTEERTIKVNALDLTDAEITLNPKSFEFDGTAKEPAIVVTLNNNPVAANGYTVSYDDNINAGTVTVTITGKNAYTGKATATFEITKASPALTATPSSIGLNVGGTAEIEITYKGNGSLDYGTEASAIATATLNGNKITVTGTGAGTTNIVVTVSAGTNHKEETIKIPVTVGSNTIIVTPKPNQGKDFGEADPRLDYTFVGNLTGEQPSFTGDLSREPGEKEGTYAITLGTLALADTDSFKASNYNLVLSDEIVNFTIKVGVGTLITEWTIPANADSDGTGTTIKLPIPSNMVNNYTVDWGDGVVEHYDSNAHFPTHEYTNTAEEVYIIKVAGTVYEFGNVAGTEPTIDNEYSNYYPFAQYLTKLVQWGELEASRIGFSGCRNLAGAIPLPTENSFVNVEDASCMFKYCEEITSVPEGLFANASNVTSFTSTFQGCSNLTSIPEKIFTNNKEVIHFNYVLRGSGLTSIPSGLFASNTKAETFAYAFADCTALTTIGTGLFDNNNEVTDFGSTFENCTSLTSIPAGLFAGKSKATNFRTVFFNCSGITSAIPEDLFDRCTAATSFELSFANCGKISGNLPATLFEDSPNVKTFSGLFEGCAGLTGDIPAGLFKNNTKVENVRTVFLNCTGLTGGEVLLDTTNVTNADMMFWNCSNMTTLILGENFKKLDASGLFGACNKLNAIIMLNDAATTSKVATLGALDTINLPTQTIIYVSNETVEAVYEEAWDGIIDATRVEPLLALEGQETVEISAGQTYTEDGYKVAGYNLTNKAEYTKYGYAATYEDSEATDALGSFVRTYTLTRTVNEVEEEIDSIERTIKVNAIDLSDAVVTLNPTSFVYDGTEKIPTIKVELGGKELSSDTDYTVSMTDNINVGKVTVTIDGKGNYTGTRTATFEITNATLGVVATDYTGVYDGKAHSISLSGVEGATVTYGTQEGTYDKAENPTYTEKGTYTVYYKVEKANYDTVTGSATVTITAKDINDLTISLTQTTFDYDGKAKEPKATIVFNGENLIEDTDYTIDYEKNTDAGQAAAIIKGKENFSGTKTVYFTINKAKLTVTASGFTGPYDGKAHEINVTAEGITDVSDAKITYAETAAKNYTETKPTYKDVGTYTVYYKVEKANYESYEGSAVVTITAKVLNVEWSNTTLVYNATYQKPTAKVTNDVAGETVILNVTGEKAAVGENYEANVSISSVTNGKVTNYELSNTTTKFSIVLDENTAFDVSLDKTSVTYDGTKHTPIATVTTTVGSKTVTLVENTDYTVDYGENINAGTGTVIITGKGNYKGVTDTQSFTINKAVITVTPKPGQYKVYGDADPKLDYSSVGAIGSEEVGFTGSLTRNSGDVVGSYAITQGTLALADTETFKKNNYTLEFSDNVVNFVITAKNIKDAVVTVTPNSYTYDGTEKKPSVVVTLDKVVLSGASAYSVGYSDNVNVGTATVTVTGTGNYTGTATGTFTITEATLTVKGNGYTGTYDGASHGITVDVSGVTDVKDAIITYGEEAGTYNLTSSPTYKNKGEYTVYFKVSMTNYKDATGSAKVVINPKSVGVVWTDTELIFNNGIQAPKASANSGITGETINLRVDGGKKDVGGPYTATASIESVKNGEVSNYTLTDTTTQFNIKLGNVSFDVDLEDIQYTYIGKAHTPTAIVKTTIGDKEVALTKDVDYTVAYANNVNAGEATVTITGIGNYKGVTKTVTFTIAKNNLTVTPTPGQKKNVGESDPALTYIFTGNISGETPGITGKLERVAGEEPGKYAINQGTFTIVNNGDFKVSNYNFIFDNEDVYFTILDPNDSGSSDSDFEIIEKEVEVVWTNTILTFNGMPQKPKAEAKSKIDGETIILSVTGEQTNIGTYTATAQIVGVTGGQNEINNYTLKNATTTFKIIADTGITFNVSLDKDSFVYTGEAHKPAVTVKVDSNGTETSLTEGTHFRVEYKNNVNAGTATVTVIGLENYDGTETAVNYTITKRDFTVTPNSGGKVYGTDDPASLAYKYTGNVNNEIPGFSGSLSREVGEDVGSYAINLGTFKLASTSTFNVDNYNLVFSSEVVYFTITPKNIAEITVTMNPSTVPFDGLPKTPDAVMVYNGNTLAKDRDFEIVYANNTNAGQATATITGKGNFTGTTEGKFTISQTALAISASGYSNQYDGKSHGITLSGTGLEGATVWYGSAEGVYETTTAPTYKDAGDYTVYFKVDKENFDSYTGSAVVSISKKDVIVRWSNTQIAYDGTYKLPTAEAITEVENESITLNIDGAQKEVGGPYTATASIASVTNGKASNYNLTETTTEFNIVLAGDLEFKVELGDTEFTYNGEYQTTTVTVSLYGTILEEGTDYKVEYSNNKNFGTATIIITGLGTYADIPEAKVNFTIKKADLVVKPISGQSKVYGEDDPELKYTPSGAMGTEKPAFSGSLERAVGENVGTYAINKGTLALIDNDKFIANNYNLVFSNETVNFTITAKDLSGAKVTTNPTSYSFDGTAKQPTVTVTLDGKTLTLGSDYGVSYDKNVNVGTAIVIVTAKENGNYKGSATGTFTITNAGLNVTATGYSDVYDGKYHGITINEISGATIKYGTTEENCNLTSSPTFKDVGENTVYFKVSKPNYNDFTGSEKVIITPKEAKVVWTNTDLTFNNAPQKPTATAAGVTGETINLNVDGAKTDVGGPYTAIASIESVTNGKATNYTLSDTTCEFTIKVDTSIKFNVTLDKSEFTYDGTEHKPTPTVKVTFGGNTVTLDSDDYDFVHSNNINVANGTTKPTVTITGKGNYYGITETINFTINKRTLTVTPTAGMQKEFSYADPAFGYSFSGQVSGEKPEFTGALARVTGEVVGTYAINKGTLALIDNDKFIANNYNLVVTSGITFEIVKADISKGTLTLTPTEVEYNSLEQKVETKVVVNNKTLVKDTDYVETYSNNIVPGTATVTVTGIGNYKGTLSETFTITPIDISKATMTITPTTFVYDGYEKEPTVTIKYKNLTLVENVDFEVEYTNNINVGTNTAIVTARGIRYYKGQLTGRFSITPKALSGKVTLSENEFEYDGTEKKPTVTFVTDEGKVLKEGVDFRVSYVDNVEVGIATVVITGIGNYEGEISTTFEIIKAYVRLTLKDKNVLYTGNEVTIDKVVIDGTEEDLSSYIQYKYYSDTQMEEPMSGLPKDVGVYYVEAILADAPNYNYTVSNKVKLVIYGAPTKPEILGKVDGEELDNGGSTSGTAEITITGSKVPNVEDVEYGYKYSLDGTTWKEYTGPIEITNEGTTTVYAKAYLKEDPTQESEVETFIVTIDRTAPIVDEIIVPDVADSVVVDVEITGEDIYEVFITEDPSQDPNEEEWMKVGEDGKTVIELTQGDEDKPIYVWIRDEAGNVSGPIEKTITLSALKIGNQNNNKTTIMFKVTDDYLHTADIKAENIEIYVDEVLSQGKVTNITKEKIDGGYKFIAIIENVTGDGALSIALTGESVYDKAGNEISSEGKKVDTNEITVDNTLPILSVSTSNNMVYVVASDANMKAVMLNGEVLGRKNGQFEGELRNGTNKVVVIDQYGNEVMQEINYGE